MNERAAVMEAPLSFLSPRGAAASRKTRRASALKYLVAGVSAAVALVILSLVASGTLVGQVVHASASEQTRDDGTRLRVSLMEEHNEAIAEWMEAQKNGRVADTFALVHFDSHPDMSMSAKPYKEIERAAASGNFEKLANMLEIDEFITAASKLGIVDHIIWIRPPWAETLTFDGSIEFTIGVDGRPGSDGQLVSDYPLPYYVLTREDRMYRPSVSKGKSIRLTVMRHDEIVAGLPRALGDRDATSVVVDFDLDYLSTNHPGLSGAAAEAGVPYNLLISTMKRISFVPRVNRWLKSKVGVRDASDVSTSAEARKQLSSFVAALNDIHGSLFAPATWEAFAASFRKMLDFIDVPADEAEDLMAAITSIAQMEGVDADMWQVMLPIVIVFPYGAPPLAEVKAMAADLGASMQGLKQALGGRAPGIVTVCRSVGSGFTPKKKASRFYNYFMKAAEDAFGDALVRVRENDPAAADWMGSFATERARQRQQQLRL